MQARRAALPIATASWYLLVGPARGAIAALVQSVGLLRCPFLGPIHAEAWTGLLGVEVFFASALAPARPRDCPRKLRGLTFLRMRQSIYEAAGGDRAFLALAEAWHKRAVADPVVGHAFAHGFNPRHTERLAAYWAEALGGPAQYTGSMGDHSSVVRMHSGNSEHREMDERALELFALAVDDAGLGSIPGLKETLVAYFRWATTLMNAYPFSADKVPPNLPMARWSWGGPVQHRA